MTDTHTTTPPDLPTLFKALADITRVRLMAVLIRHELRVGELVQVMDMGQSRISRHLRILSDCGLVSSRRDGLWAYYSAAKGSFPFLSAVKPFFEESDPLWAKDLANASQVLKDRENAVRSFFQDKAGDWDRLRLDILGTLDLEAEIIARMRSCPTAADLGCGAGHLLPALLSKADRVVGVDSSSSMLEEALKRLRDKGERVSLRLGTLEHLPLSDREADFALCSMVLHHLSDPREGLSDAWRVLASGGTLVLVELDKHDRESMRQEYGDQWLGFQGQELAEWLQRAGFELSDHARYTVEHNLGVHIMTARKQ